MRLLLPLLLISACKGDDPPLAPADLIFENGTIHRTAGDPTDRIAVEAGVVVATGEEVEARQGANTVVVDLGGAVAWPGFTDNHTHLLAGSFVMDRLLLLGVGSMDAISDKLADYALEAPDEPWLVGYGWLKELIEDPSGVALDAVVSDRPVLLVDNSGHAALVNSKAMELAGIDRNTPQPEVGEIALDPETGDPTGLLTEGALSLVSEVALEDYDDMALGAGLEKTLDQYVDGGVTGVEEIVASPGFDLTRPWIYRDLDDAGLLDMRVHVFVPVFAPDDIFAAADFRDSFDTEHVRFAGAKIWVDGSMGTGDAWVSEPLVDEPGEFGAAYFDAADLLQVVRDAESLGIPLKLHANGDAAIHAALDAFEAVAAENVGLTQTHCLDHVVLIQPEDRSRMAELGMVANVQPAHWIGAQMGDIVDEWGADRFAQAYDQRALVDAGVQTSLGTDWPVWPSPSAPIQLWAASVVRGQAQGVTRLEALQAYTEGAAIGLGRTDLGCLDVGCAADVVTFDADPLTVADEDLSQMEITGVWLGGVQVR